MDEQEGFEALVEREYTSLLRAATLIVGDEAAARDVVQEAFTRALVRWRRISRYDKPGAWLRLVTVRLAVRTRDRSRRQAPEHLLWDLGRADPGVDTDLLAAIADLSPSDRAVVVMHHLWDLPVTEVADAVGSSPGAVRVRLHRARARLATALGEEIEHVTP